MSWFPMGPDFVFAPRDGNFKRLSLRNELGRQGLVSNIAIDPTDPTTIYVVVAPTSGGTSAFRTGNGGASWIPIIDSLQQTDPLDVNPTCIAINPAHTNIIYLSTYSGEVYASNDQGNTWGPRNNVGGNVIKLIVDPRTASNPASTLLYAATNTGVFRSPDGGATWTNVLAGNIVSLVAFMPNMGTAHYYAGVYQTGVFHTTDPTTAWTNLNNQGIGLPAHTANNFDDIAVDFCRQNPNRVYVWLAKPNATVGLFTTSSPLTSWTSVAAASPPNPGQGFYSFTLAVAPNSPGDGLHDILFFASVGLFRSTDGGQTWAGDGIGFHADQHAFAFFPENPPAGVIPAFYAGCDGGIAVSDGFADPAFSIATAVTDFNEGLSYTDSGVYQNLNHGMQSSAVYQYTSDPSISALSYIGCQDTGINAGTGTLGWRGIADADGGSIADVAGTDGVKVWAILGAPFSDYTITDKGDFNQSWSQVTLGSGGPAVVSVSNHVVGLDKNCLAGVAVLNQGASLSAPITATGIQTATPSSMTNIVTGAVLSIDSGPNQENVIVTATTATTFTASFTKTHTAGVGIEVIAGTSLSAPVTAIGTQTATPVSMANIVIGASLTIDSGSNQENVIVTATTATTFTASFAKTHATGAPVKRNLSFAVRIGHDSIATQVSQDFGLVHPHIIAASPVDPNILFFATDDQRLWMTTSGASAGPGTVWTEITASKPIPAPGDPPFIISSIALDNAGNVYVLLRFPITTGGGEFITITPLFKISAGTWVAQNCINLPTGNALGFGKMVADPVQSDTLYASNDARVYKLTLSASSWTWTDISDGLPGQWIYDLWIGNIGISTSPKVILRAAVPSRGIWERDVTTGATDLPVSLYVRDNFLDQGWLVPSPDGLINPFNPAAGVSVFHYQCADLKVDAQQQGSGGVADFFQTDPEGSTLPISHVLFDELKDNSQNLPGADTALVHVQVHNRSNTPANNVHVWVIYCNASAGVPALSQSPSRGNAFPFWSQFTVTGQIIPNLPSDSPWRSVGPAQTLSGISAANPQVASWRWPIPLVPSGDPGHFCMVVFIHSATSPINETGTNVDEITPRNKQIGQKNLHIGPPLPPNPMSPAGGARGSPSAGMMQEYVEFHNPTSSSRVATLVFDLRQLPPQLHTSFKLTPLDTVNPLPNSLVGVAAPMQPGVIEKAVEILGSLFGWLILIGQIIQLLGCLIENLGRLIVGLPLKSCRGKPHIKFPRFAPTLYEALPSTRVEVRGVRIPPFGFSAALLSIRNRGILEEGSEYQFEVQQQVQGQVVGGSTYVVRIAGVKKLPVPLVLPTMLTGQDEQEVARIERESERFQYAPPWAKDIIEARKQEQGKEP